MATLTNKLATLAAQRLAEQNRNLATGMQSTANAVQTDPTKGIGASQSQDAEQQEDAAEQAPAGGYKACAIKSLVANKKRFYPVEGYFVPENDAQKAECERWVALGLISPPVAPAAD